MSRCGKSDIKVQIFACLRGGLMSSSAKNCDTKKIVCRMSEPPRIMACLNYFIFIFSIRHHCMFWSWRHVYIMDIMTVAYTYRVFATRRSKMFFFYLFIFHFFKWAFCWHKPIHVFHDYVSSLVFYLLLWFFLFFFIFILGMSCNGYSFK